MPESPPKTSTGLICHDSAVSIEPVRPPRWRIPFLPACGALLVAWLSLTPSLLPRSGLFQGLLVGGTAMFGYAIGALIGWLLRGVGLRLNGRFRRFAWIIFALVAVIGTAAMLILSVRWQQTLREAVGAESLSFTYVPLTIAVGVIVAVIVLAVARLLRGAGRFTGRQIGRVLPGPVAAVLAVLLVAGGAWWVVDATVTTRVLHRLDATFIALNDEFRTDLTPPTSENLTAGPNSELAWDDLGRFGRLFIANAPSPESISEFTGEPALQPVRAYVGVGLEGEIDLQWQADVAVRELELTGGFDRKVLNVVTSTGRGWVNENQIRGLEYMWGGDTATVSMQYSYLPSWMSFLADGNRAETAGRLLFTAVYDHWLTLPEDARPLLVVSGESLGTYGAEAAFSGAQDLANRTSGALFVGPTGNNSLWSQFTAEREPASPEILPIYNDGRTVRFADSPNDFANPKAPWGQPRVGYLQHANDPVTWWNWSLAIHKPDWLRETRGRGVPEQMHWIPVITLLQVALDQLPANDFGPGEGHEFGSAPVYAWAQILPPPDWTDTETERLAEAVAASPRADDE